MRLHRNFWSIVATWLLRVAHWRAPGFRWSLLAIVVGAWLAAGMYGWTMEDSTIRPHDAFYRTIGALSMSDIYLDAQQPLLDFARFAGLSFPIVGIVFAFWGQLGRSLAHAAHGWAGDHIVIAGASAEALHLAKVCRQKGDSVDLIAAGLGDDQTWVLRKSGVFVTDGVGSDHGALRSARARHAAHVVAFEEDDTANLQIEAAVRSYLGKHQPREPISVHVATRSAMLLREAREMRSMEARQRKEGDRIAIDPKPFSLAEIAARQLVQTQSPEVLDLATQLNAPQPHLVLFGFDAGAQAVAARVLMSLWSARLGEPRITVLTPDHELCAARFRASHPEALAHGQLWKADIEFLHFDWVEERVETPLLERVSEQRGAPTGVVVSVGSDPENIRLALAIKRAANQSGMWPGPIYMKESAKSEFSAVNAFGDTTAELDAFLYAFGALEETATRETIIEGELDRGAAIAHEQFLQGFSGKEMSMRELSAMARDWNEVLETYRSANRAVADSAIVKIWDAGWRAAPKKAKGETSPTLPGDMMEAMARREHDRWVAERLMSGWRPGAKRDNALLVHDKLVGWDALTEEDRGKDATQVRAAIDIARLANPQGFVSRS